MFALIAPIITSVQVVSAEKTYTVGNVNVTPNPAQVDEYVLIAAWISPQPIPRGIYTDYYIDVTSSSGKTDTFGPFDSYLDGSAFMTYIPKEIGLWKAVLRWEGDELRLGAVSKPYEFTVQEDPIAPYPENPLPTEYWTRPINAEMRSWTSISGNWLKTGRHAGYNATMAGFNPYSTAPNSPHILWKKPALWGGLIGGEFESTRFVNTYYESLYPQVMGGKIFWKEQDEIHCWDYYTGEEIYTITGSTGKQNTQDIWLAPGPLVGYDRYVDVWQSQTQPWLWDWNTTHICKYRPTDGKLIWALTRPADVKSFGATLFVPEENYAYTQVTNIDGSRELIKWMPTEMPLTAEEYVVLPPATANFTNKIVWRVECPSIGMSIAGDYIYFGANNQAQTAAMNRHTGEMLWDITREYISICRGTVHNGVAAWPVSVRSQVVGYDLATGLELWGSEVAGYPWGTFWAYAMGAAYGNFYAGCYDGHVYAIDSQTGETVWKFYSGDALRRETPYGTWPFFSNPAIADGKLYFSTSEHTPSDPMIRDNKLYCIDAFSGEEIWRISWAGGAKAIADSRMLGINEYDNCFYVFGKGPTATTVAASPKVSMHGTNVLIEGSVTDVSVGTTDHDRSMRFPQGVPAVSEESMTEWMEYVYMQKPRPTDATGVTVTLDTVDPNGNWIHIGEATSDMSGFYSYMWTPDIEGKYTIIATFEGSDSYWASYDETAIGVGPAVSPAQPIEPEPTTPEPTEPTPTEPTPTTAAPFITTEIAIITAVAIACVIGVAAFWALRKRK